VKESELATDNLRDYVRDKILQRIKEKNNNEYIPDDILTIIISKHHPYNMFVPYGC
jgi:hypothetical protein